MRSLILAALLTSALTPAMASEIDRNEIIERFLVPDRKEHIREQAYMQILGINPNTSLTAEPNALSDNIADVQLVFRPAGLEPVLPGSVTVYAGNKMSIRRLIDLVGESVGYAVDYTGVSEKTLSTEVDLPSHSFRVEDILSEIEDQTSIDVVLFPKNAGRYILLFESL